LLGPKSYLIQIWIKDGLSSNGVFDHHKKVSVVGERYAAFHGMALLCHIEGSMINAVWTHLRMFLNSKFHRFRVKCWILLKPVLGGVDGKLHFTVPSMNRLDQTEPAAFSILSCWAFFRDSVLLYFIVTSVFFLCRLAAVKSLPVH
jgi:hypothetical protein